MHHAERIAGWDVGLLYKARLFPPQILLEGLARRVDVPGRHQNAGDVGTSQGLGPFERINGNGVTDREATVAQPIHHSPCTLTPCLPEGL
jgi:hypothetical protein